MLEDLLSLALSCVDLELESVAKAPLEIVWGIALKVHSILDDANSVTYLLSFFNVLSRYQNSSLFALDDLFDQLPNLLS